MRTPYVHHLIGCVPGGQNVRDRRIVSHLTSLPPRPLKRSSRTSDRKSYERAREVSVVVVVVVSLAIIGIHALGEPT